jgi:hypothetical protein
VAVFPDTDRQGVNVQVRYGLSAKSLRLSANIFPQLLAQNMVLTLSPEKITSGGLIVLYVANTVASNATLRNTHNNHLRNLFI